MEELNKASLDLVKKFIETPVNEFENYVQIGENFYMVQVKQLSKDQVKKLKEEGYI